MEKITFYKLQSPYPEDVTKDCKLTMPEIDENFLTLKDNDIKEATYNENEMSITIVKNNGDMLNIDISEIKKDINAEVEEQLSAITKHLSGVTIPTNFYYYAGSSIAETISTEVIENDLREYEGKTANLYNTIHTDENEYIWVMLPEPIKLQFMTENGIQVTLSEPHEQIDYKGKTYNAYRNLVTLQNMEWNLQIYTRGSKFDEFGINTGIQNIDLHAELTSDGILNLNWETTSGRTETSVSGFLTISDKMYSDGVSINGDGTKVNSVRLSNLEKTSTYKSVLGIVDILPNNPNNGDRYVTSATTSNFGVLYSKQGVELVKDKLKETGLSWRVPTKSDWDKFLQEIEICNHEYGSDEIDIEQGEIAGKILKSVDYWEGNENLDTYKFTVLPSYYADEYKELITDTKNAILWTDTEFSGNTNYMKEFLSDKDTVRQIASKEDEMYALRLVMDYEDNKYGFNANIFGKEYGIVPVPAIKQIWINSNLDELLGSEDYNKRYEYDSNIVNINYYINHWNGLFWEKRQLANGDTIVVEENGSNVNYSVLNSAGNSYLIKTVEVYKGKAIYDAGWY